MADALAVGVLVVVVVVAASLARLPPSIAISSASLIAIAVTSGLARIPEVYASVLSNYYTLEAIAGVAAVAWLVSLYRNTGVAEVLGEELSRALRSPRVAAAGIPAVLGLLPVPGGALMSAPVVNEIGDRLGWTSLKKLFVNVWFRHALVIAYPLNSIIVMTASLAGVSLWALVAWALVASLVMVLIGLIAIRESDGVLEKSSPDFGKLARSLAPMLTSISIAICGEMAGLSSRLAVLVGVALSIPVFIIASGSSFSKALSPIRDHTVWDIVMVTFSALVLREVFAVADYSSINSIGSKVGALALIAVPALFGVLSGAASVSVSVSIPMVSALKTLTVNEVALIYVAAFTGYMVSPLHLCLVYTLRYYNVSLIDAYKLLVPASLAFLLITSAVFLAV